MNEKQQQNNDWSKREIGALWKKEGKNQKYLSGYFKDELGERVEIVVFANKFKDQNEKAPDYRVYISKQTEDKPTQVKTQEKVVAKKVSPKVSEVELEEELL